MTTYDAIVLGVGGVGSAALYHLARRGLKVVGVDRFPPGHDRGSSHGSTRIIRQAYFEHADYVPLLLRAYELWAELERECGRPLYRQTGLLQVGPPEGAVVPGVLGSAQRHGLPIERLMAAEISARWPGFRIGPELCGLFEHRAGYLHVEACVKAHAEAAVRHGARLIVGEAVRQWRAERDGFVVETDGQRLTAPRLVVAAGAWSGPLLADLGLKLRVRRKPQFWYRPASEAAYSVDNGCPAFLFETPQGMFYGFPQHDKQGVKVAEHTGGAAVDDPLSVDRQLDPLDAQRVEQFTAEHLPALSRELIRHSVCLYTLSPDEHFIVDRHPGHAGLVFAAGLSGHGFKFTCVLGQLLSELALGISPSLAVDFLSLSRPGLEG